MVDEPASGPGEHADEWLHDEHDELRSGLSRFLDVDRGLSEVRTHVGGHGDVVRGLGGVLDVEGGLASILGTGGAAGTGPSTGTGESAIAAAVRAVPVERRLALRQHPAAAVCVGGGLLVRAVELAADLDGDRHRLVLADDNWLDHYRERVYQLAGEFDRFRPFDTPQARDRTRDLVRHLMSTRARGRTRDFAGENVARALAADLADALARFLAEALDAGLGLTSVLELARARGLALDIRNRLALDVAVVRARALADDVALEAGRRLDLPDTAGLADALLDGVLDDFTRADLTDVDLDEADLAGIHWSERGTRWPLGTDIEDLRRRSQETAPNSGVHVLGQPPAGNSRTGDGIRV
ncbi:hypothetical protein AB0L99_24295 [Streptomyces sp. NPDC051954]|uniref:hypothetical protein n=1 Tax=Streptomyces sp. NPDC051954 TaxID=3155524 RepID=UPI0034222578